MDQSSILELLEKPTPRYTSYPTANHFQKAASPNLYEKYLSTATGEASLYIHIPFCHSLCTYCGCFTRIPGDYDRVMPYVDSLIEEMQLVFKHTNNNLNIKHIHFGGGTPTYLAKEELAKIFSAIQRYFSIDPNAEIAIEIDPRTISTEMLSVLKDYGVNRVSLGIQDLNNDVQKAINRVQPFDLIQNCVDKIRSHGINAINFDLMYGLPLQTTQKIENNLELSLTLNPSRIAFFGYAHTPWIRNHQKKLEQYTLPNTQERLNQFIFGRNFLTSNGYLHFGIDHFAKAEDPITTAFHNKSLRRNFQGYTTDTATTLIGLGVSAISSFKDAFFQNSLNISDYKNKIAHATFATSKEIFLSKEDLIRQSIISEIMCFAEVELKKTCADLYDKIFNSSKQKLYELEKLELIQLIDKKLLKVTAPGQLFLRLVSSYFDAYLEQNVLHSKIM